MTNPLDMGRTDRHKKLKELREPFPASVIGKLPRAYKKDDRDRFNCNVCGGYHAAGVHLDYVGHAAVTDRLLNIDPEWNWEPMAVDDHGLPVPDRANNLWIRLTVCGVTRIGVGDGSSVKEMIGDAIRNAAMRFGVALELWTKNDLESATVEAHKVPAEYQQPVQAVSVPTEPAARSERPPATAAAAKRAELPEAADETRRKEMFALFGERPDLSSKPDRLNYCSMVTKREITSSSQLNLAEVKKVIKQLRDDKNKPAEPNEADLQAAWEIEEEFQASRPPGAE